MAGLLGAALFTASDNRLVRTTSLDSKVQLDRHKDIDWYVSDPAGRKPPLPNGCDRFLIEASWIE